MPPPLVLVVARRPIRARSASRRSLPARPTRMPAARDASAAAPWWPRRRGSTTVATILAALRLVLAILSRSLRGRLWRRRAAAGALAAALAVRLGGGFGGPVAVVAAAAAVDVDLVLVGRRPCRLKVGPPPRSMGCRGPACRRWQSLRGSGNTVVAARLDASCGVARHERRRSTTKCARGCSSCSTPTWRRRRATLYGWSDQDFRNIGFTDVMALQQLMQAIRASAAVTPMRH
jgi:hypothetical protein